MKKLLSIATLSVLLSVGAIADNTITVNGEVLAGAQVTFGAPSGQDLVGGELVFEDATISFEVLELGKANVNEQQVFVNTNSNSGVSIALETTPDLSDENGHSIPTTYALGDVPLVAGTAQSLVDTTNDGQTALPVSFVTTATTTADQISGLYGTTLGVIIAQN
jgi:hypothetical protein